MTEQNDKVKCITWFYGTLYVCMEGVEDATCGWGLRNHETSSYAVPPCNEGEWEDLTDAEFCFDTACIWNAMKLNFKHM